MPHVRDVVTPRPSRARFAGRRLIQADGVLIGTVVEVYTDDPAAAWALVRERRIGGRKRVVPIDEAHSSGTGVVVPYTRANVRHAPQIERGAPSLKESERLTTYYRDLHAPPAAAVAEHVTAPHEAAPAATAELDQATAEAEYQNDKLRLYRAKNYRGGATSDSRLRELERKHDSADARLRGLRERRTAGDTASADDGPA